MSFKKLVSIGTGLVVAITAAVAVSMAGNASAIACYKYDPSGNFQTSTTPVFNNICGITTNMSSTQGNYALGDETDFVRIRQNTSGSPLGSSNPKLVNDLTSACDNGTNFDIWTYIHNDAMADYNDNGNGSAVAHDVKLAMSAPINTTGNHFSFGSTISARNAASVNDSASLTCNGQPVKLTLVPSAVYYNNDVNQTNFSQLPDSAVNGTTTVGSPNMGSGDEWGCWNYRIVVVYRVTVQKEQPTPSSAVCNMFTVTASEDKKVKVSAFKYTAENSNFKQVVVNWGDNNSNTYTNANAVVGQGHQYNSFGTYLITAVVTFDENGKEVTSGGAGTACAEQVTFTPNQPPTVTPPTPPTGASGSPAPTSLVNTGPGSTLAAFAVATIAGTLAYRRFLSRRLSRQ
ncbi:MAG TPA: hypothetical protein VHB72_02130 [Candidatus Saccharimonadales bacterium]|nr:hypothetical protein [Candidatus Saccharimonadales bacterium]